MKINKLSLISLLGFIISLSLVSCDGGSSSETTADDIGSENDIVLDIPDNLDTVVEDAGGDVDPEISPDLEAQYADEVFASVNQERASRSLPALVRDGTMDSLCAGHNTYLVGNATPNGAIQINHDNAESRINILFSDGYKSFAENVAAHRGVASANVASTFVQNWVASPEHLKNLTGSYTFSGIAVKVDTRDGTVYVTQIFGSK
jgi:uncharacterized protein YkwD